MMICRKLGDGRCDVTCHHESCRWDDGDCLQLCFSPELTNCTYDKVFNDKCDNGCNNKYCSLYQWGSNFLNPATSDEHGDGVLYSGDLFHCLYEEQNNNTNINNADTINATCAESWISSQFTDPNVPRFVNGEAQWDDCEVCDYPATAYQFIYYVYIFL